MDQEPLLSDYAGDPDLEELIEIFSGSMREKIAAVDAHLEAGDWDALRVLAHQLKGAAGSYGYPIITEVAARAEKSIMQEEGEEAVRAVVAELRALCYRATLTGAAP